MKPQRLAALIALLAIVALGIAIGPVAAPNVAFLQKLQPKLGLDIQGGARVVLEADTSKLPAGKTWDQTTKNAVINILSQRVNANGVSEAVITPKGLDQFVVELPAVKNEQQILDQLQNTAQLQFFYNPDWRTQRNQYGRFVFQSQNDPSGKREAFEILDSTSKKTFRDRFHISQAFGELVNGSPLTAVAGLVETPIPDNLQQLSAAQGRKTLFLKPDQQKTLSDLSDELTQFDAFLAAPTQLIMDGSDLLPNSRGEIDPNNPSRSLVELEFNAAGKDKFATFTKDHTNEILMIYLDGRILMAPNIEVPILDGRAQISPFPTVSDAKELADYLNGGALPVPLKIVEQRSVAATLGTEAVHQGFTAGLIGLGLVMGFMILYYLLPGSIACAALILYTLFTYAAFLLAGVTFTLPGIAGFILSVGMAVDANILIFERTKEELRDGRQLRSAVEAGFQRAFSAIFDSNVCTAFTSICLYEFGSGPVRGFALTLLIGVLISMFTAITVSRTFLLLLVGKSGAQSQAAWGVNRSWIPRFNVVKSRGAFYALSLLVIVPGVVFALMGGFKPGIDFTGGTEIQLQFPATTAVTREKLEGAVKKLGFEDPAAQIAGNNTVFLRLPKQKDGEVTKPKTEELVAKLQTDFPGVTEDDFSLIGSSISAELTRSALTSILFSSAFIVLYLAFRFAIGGFVNGLKFGIAAIIAMLHDVCVLIGVFSFLGYLLNWKVDSLFVTAALTVIGFSVHDTIVIFDRMRENLRGRVRENARDGDLHDNFSNVVARSINETFSRSINTSFTVVLTLLALLIWGGPVIRPLNAALLIGIISGTYSSIFNAAPLVVDWERLFGGKTSGTSTGSAPSRGNGGGSTPPRPAAPSPSAGNRNVPPLTPTPRGGSGGAGLGSRGDVPSTPRPDGTTGSGASGERPPLPPGPKPRKRRM